MWYRDVITGLLALAWIGTMIPLGAMATDGTILCC
jgi:hypothetical protein